MSATDALRDDLLAAYSGLLERRRRHRRLARLAAIACAGALVLAGAGFGAATLFGWPAPPHVQNELASVDRGLPADLRLNPDVDNARAVAATATSTLYAASLPGGGSCSEIVTTGERGRGATCAEYASALQMTVPSDAGAGPQTPVVVGGRLPSSATRLEARYPGGSAERVPLGDDRFFLFDVPARQLTSVHVAGLTLVALDQAGAVVARQQLPADWDDPAASDEQAPIYVSTRSDESDLTKVYGLEGHVGATEAARLELDYGNGTTVGIPLQPDGGYEYTVPPQRVGDFMTPRTLVAYDADGRVVARANVAAVAYWRGRERSVP
jgi:hypothetical protein